MVERVLDVRILGAVEVVDGGLAIPIRSRRERTVLVALAADAGHVVSIDRLVRLLWDDDPPATAAKSLQTAVSTLRHTLGDGASIERLDAGYRMTCASDAVDLGRFERLAAAAGEGSTDDQVSALEQALAEWRSPDPPDLGTTTDALTLRRALAERRNAVEDALVEALRAAGRPDEAVVRAEAVLDRDPHRVPTWELLITILVGRGRTADALAAYQRARTRFVDDLGLDPPASLRALERRALQADAASSRAELESSTEAPAIRDESVSRLRLPLEVNSFVGRRDELELLARLIGESRLVTVHGSGGVGKTRLALRAANAWQRGRDGRSAWFWDLTRVTSTSDLGVALAEEVDAPHGPGIDALAAATAELARWGRTLVVVDNCEHVVDPIGAVVDRLLRVLPNVRFVATSRLALGVDGERVVPIDALPIDGPGGAADLLVGRAADSGVALSEDDPALRSLCARLGGLPLALELVAPRLRTRRPDEIEAAIDAMPLEIGPIGSTRRSGGRQRSVLDAVRWSYDLLPADAQLMLLVGAAFRTPVVVDDVAHVASAVFDLDPATVPHSLDLLADHALLRVDTTSDPSRFALQPVVRDGCLALADEFGYSEALRSSHARWAALRSRQLTDLQWTPMEGDAIRELVRLTDDLRAGLSWAVAAREIETAVAIAAPTVLFGMFTLRGDVLRWSYRTVEDFGAHQTHPAWSELLAAASFARDVEGNHPAGGELTQIALELIDSGRTLPNVLIDGSVALSHLATGDIEGALAAFRALDLPHDRDWLSIGQPLVANLLHSDLRADGVALLDEMDAFARRCGAPSVLASALVYRAELAAADGDLRGALDITERAIQLAESVGNRFLPDVATMSLASYACRAGATVTALDAFESVLGHLGEHGVWEMEWTVVRNLVVLLDHLDQHHDVVVLAAAMSGAAAISAARGDLARALDVAVERAHDALGSAGASTAAATGAALTADAAIAYALDAVRRLRVTVTSP